MKQDERAWQAVMNSGMKTWMIFLPDGQYIVGRAETIEEIVLMVDTEYSELTTFMVFDGVQMYRVNRRDS